MTNRLAFTLLTAFLPLHAQEEDLLRFTNGDQLQGAFKGLGNDNRIVWHRTDVEQPLEFQRDKVRQIVLKGARPLTLTTDSSHLSLVNGDRIPGRILSADDATIHFETLIGGTLSLPRDVVSNISPNPFGGRLLYAGPFDDRDWRIINPVPPASSADRSGETDEAPKAAWNHSGAAWYFREGQEALVLDANLPERALIRFKMAWRSTLNVAFAFHADLKQPEPEKEEAAANDAARRQFFGGPQAFPRYFGSSYVATFQPGYSNLYRCGYDDDGQPISTRIRSSPSQIRMNPTGESVFEVRCDRRSGMIAVYIDGEMTAQWYTREDSHDGDVYSAGGGAIGFHVIGSAPTRISDVIIAEWNGLTDSARSMDSEDSDIVLLANGTDRFSGKVTSIQDGTLELDGKYAGLKVPLSEVAEVHFARSTRRKPNDARVSDIVVHFQPVGRISGNPVSATEDRFKIDSPLAGSLDVDLSPAVLIEFQSAGGFLDTWDDDF